MTTPSASPSSAWPLVCEKSPPTINITPINAAARPARNNAAGFLRQIIHAASVTNIGARFASSTAFATEVSTIDQCHTAKSPAKKNPAANSSPRGLPWAAALPRGRLACAHAHKNGSARNTRQNAVDTGPASLTFTHSAEVPMQVAPANSASRASERARASVALALAPAPASTTFRPGADLLPVTVLARDLAVADHINVAAAHIQRTAVGKAPRGTIGADDTITRVYQIGFGKTQFRHFL